MDDDGRVAALATRGYHSLALEVKLGIGGACIVRDGLGRAKGGFALDSEFRAPRAAGGSEMI